MQGGGEEGRRQKREEGDGRQRVRVSDFHCADLDFSNPSLFPSLPPSPSPGNCECSDRGSFHILYGAIVGGPREDDSHHDKCADFIT